MLKKLFVEDLYIKIYINRFEVKNVSLQGEWKTLCADSAFSSTRLLVGNFTAAEQALSAAVKSAASATWLRKRPRIIMQPMELLEGGLSEVEERLLKELAYGVGAFKAMVHIGGELSNEQATERLNHH
jgi:hypothetical protein